MDSPPNRGGRRALDVLRQELADRRTTDDLVDALCAVLRDELGPAAMPSVYVAGGDRLWLAAQRGYPQVIHALPLDAGYFGRAFSDRCTVLVEGGAQVDPVFIHATDRLQAMVVTPFSSGLEGVIGIESSQRLDAGHATLLEGAARLFERALAGLPAAERRHTTVRLRLMRAFNRLGALDEPAAVAELLARTVGDALGLDLVQVALGPAGELETATAWRRASDGQPRLADRDLAAIAEAFRHEAGSASTLDAALPPLAALGREGVGVAVGIPLWTGRDLVGYLVGFGRELVPGSEARFDDAAAVAAHAAQHLVALRQRAELEAAAARYAAVIGAISEGVVVHDADGRVVAANASAERMLGSAAAPVAGRRLDDATWGLVDEDGEPLSSSDHPAALTLATGRAQGATVFGLRRPDGGVTWTSVNTEPMRNGSRLGVVATFTDVTDRRAAERAVVAERERAARVLESIDEYLYAYRLFPDGRVETIAELSSRPRALAHLPIDGLDTDWRASLVPEDQAVVQAGHEALRRLEPVEYEYRLRSADGTPIWLWARERSEPEADGVVLVHGILTDISERKRIEARLADALAEAREGYAGLDAATERIRRIVSTIDECFHTFELRGDGTWTFQFVGESWRRLLGHPPPGLTAEQAWDQAVHPDDAARYFGMDARLELLQPVDIEYRVIGFDGHTRWMWERLRPIARAADGRIVVDGVIQDVTERKRAEADLAAALATAEEARAAADRASRTDSLTGLANRRDLSEALASQLAADARAGRATGLLLLDVDRFKDINDHHGHAAGDAVLREVARRVVGAVRTVDMVARWGGEEFAVLLPGIGEGHDLRRAAERVRARVAALPATVAGDEITVTVSVGAAATLEGARASESLINAADRALYGAKRAGRDRVRLATDLVDHERIEEEPEAIRIAQALALTVSVREGLTERHDQCVADLSGAIAVQLGLPARTAALCRVAGWLHDVGKTAVPDGILAKDGPLDDGEWGVMRRHPVIGQAIVRRVPILADAAPGIRHHHERWDGEGYPDGLAGEGIPIEGRIVAVADAYSALVTQRAHRAPLDHDAALQEVRLAAGEQFDPQVVAALESVVARNARDVGSPVVR